MTDLWGPPLLFPRIVEKFQSWIDHFHSCSQAVRGSLAEAVTPSSVEDKFVGNGASEMKADAGERSAELSERGSNNLAAVNAGVTSLNKQQGQTANVGISGTGETANSHTSEAAGSSAVSIPDYPLFPLSKGFCMSIKRCLESFKTALQKAQLAESTERTSDSAAGNS